MSSYLPINWWSGNLRYHESIVSFLTRFCNLNFINLKRCREYFDFYFDGNRRLAATDIRRLSEYLNEPLDVVQTVFSPSITVERCGSYSATSQEWDPYSLRYCEACAQRGYHSYLHEVGWLKKCPFHARDLTVTSTMGHSGPVMVRRMAALKQVMQTACKSWPRSERNACFEKLRGECFENLVNWIARVRRVADQLSSNELWYSDTGSRAGALSVAQAVGQLRTFEPLPRIVEPLFADLGQQWRVEIRRFPEETKLELARLKPDLDFSTIFAFYKRISAFSTTPPPFVTHLRAIQALIRAEHGTCRCRWGLTSGGWEAHWVRIPPEDQPYFPHECPYEFALKELERGWGRLDLALSNRKAEAERSRLFELSRNLFDCGLISYTEDAALLPDGYLNPYRQSQLGCEWVQNSPLTDLLDAAAELEVKSAFLTVMEWLDGIDDGLEPRIRRAPMNCVRLKETAEGLSLVSWTPVNACAG